MMGQLVLEAPAIVEVPVDPWGGLYRPEPGSQGSWLAWCTSEYTLDLCNRVRDLLRADGWTVRVDHKGRHLAGDGEYHGFGKVYFRGTRGAPDAS